MPLIESLHPDKPTGVFSFDHPDAMRHLSDFTLSHAGQRLSAFELLEQVSRLFKHHASVPGIQSKSNADIYLDAAVRYIELNLQTPVTVRELTDFLGITQAYLFKLFRARLGRSPKHILDRKMERAQTLLRQTDFSVTHIANSVGFSDALAFSHCFKTKLGRSPQAYRNEWFAQKTPAVN